MFWVSSQSGAHGWVITTAAATGAFTDWERLWKRRLSLAETTFQPQPGPSCERLPGLGVYPLSGSELWRQLDRTRPAPHPDRRHLRAAPQKSRQSRRAQRHRGTPYNVDRLREDR